MGSPTSINRGILDQQRRLLRPPAARDRYLTFMNDFVTVGLQPRPLTPVHTPAIYVILVADLLNAGNIYCGGQNLTVFNGLPLDPGRATGYSVPDYKTDEMRGNATGTFPQHMPAAGWTELDRPIEPNLILSLREIYVVADVPDQIVRFQWVLPIR